MPSRDPEPVGGEYYMVAIAIIVFAIFLIAVKMNGSSIWNKNSPRHPDYNWATDEEWEK